MPADKAPLRNAEDPFPSEWREANGPLNLHGLAGFLLQQPADHTHHPIGMVLALVDQPRGLVIDAADLIERHRLAVGLDSDQIEEGRRCLAAPDSGELAPGGLEDLLHALLGLDHHLAHHGFLLLDHGTYRLALDNLEQIARLAGV